MWKRREKIIKKVLLDQYTYTELQLYFNRLFYKLKRWNIRMHHFICNNDFDPNLIDFTKDCHPKNIITLRVLKIEDEEEECSDLNYYYYQHYSDTLSLENNQSITPYDKEDTSIYEANFWNSEVIDETMKALKSKSANNLVQNVAYKDEIYQDKENYDTRLNHFLLLNLKYKLKENFHKIKMLSPRIRDICINTNNNRTLAEEEREAKQKNKQVCFRDDLTLMLNDDPTFKMLTIISNNPLTTRFANLVS
ncbi:uncharacterized protein SCDLUD_003064 [Saccharomycodes ludwigii]|uniref:uncharacterized protein n=1 Tax=Saccharomycodes ludwigii TaxID=36035 RepID=UPI001E8C2838|nr:hypothetical protein SCDLUD_003064 [Saccharomycodes ludwigii]KAH3900097.1 hypothetical protein SCDLUD_003064 [Saccharomycodes ludwigii]